MAEKGEFRSTYVGFLLLAPPHDPDMAMHLMPSSAMKNPLVNLSSFATQHRDFNATFFRTHNYNLVTHEPNQL